MAVARKLLLLGLFLSPMLCAADSLPTPWQVVMEQHNSGGKFGPSGTAYPDLGTVTEVNYRGGSKSIGTDKDGHAITASDEVELSSSDPKSPHYVISFHTMSLIENASFGKWSSSGESTDFTHASSFKEALKTMHDHNYQLVLPQASDHFFSRAENVKVKFTDGKKTKYESLEDFLSRYEKFKSKSGAVAAELDPRMGNRNDSGKAAAAPGGSQNPPATTDTHASGL